MRSFIFKISCLILCLAALGCAQSLGAAARYTGSGVLPPGVSANPSFNAVGQNVVSVASSAPLPRMGPELALQVYRNRTSEQAEQLTSYSAETVVRAELPDTQQYGEYELQRQYSAPRKVAFKAIRFTGDNFVKSNVILRLLQAEATHVEKDDPALNALNSANYKFSYKGTTELQGRSVHVYQVKPRHKRAGLFKGRIYLDAYTASMVRAEGKPVKSPSLFVKRVEFVQDYQDIDQFTLPLHIHSEAVARIVGRTIVDINYSDYRLMPDALQARSAPAP